MINPAPKKEGGILFKLYFHLFNLKKTWIS